MAANQPNSKSEIPAGIGKPAERALASAGFTHLEDFTRVTEKEVLKLHGMGPKAMGKIRVAMEEKGLTFAE